MRRPVLALLLATAIAALGASPALAVDNTAPTAVLDVPSSPVTPGAASPLSGTHSSDVGGTIVQYRWTVGSRAPVVTTSPTFNAPGLPTGQYSVSLVVVDDSGNQSSPDTKT